MSTNLLKTTALDNNYALNIKLKQALKEKAAVRDKLLDLRQRREEIAVKMDAVRARHERAMRAAQVKFLIRWRGH